MKNCFLFLAAFVVFASTRTNAQRPATLPETKDNWAKYGLYQPDLMDEAAMAVRSGTLLSLGSYKLTTTKTGALVLGGLGGIANGMLQGYQFDGRKSFERKWGADPYGYWGSLSWAQRYKNHSPEQGLAHPLYRHLPVLDFYHTAQFAQNYPLYFGGVVLGVGAIRANKKWWHYAIDITAATGVNLLCRQIGLAWIRN